MKTVQRILNLMKTNNVTASQLTKDGVLSNGLITQWKKGLQEPSSKSLKAIADYFGVSTDYLLGNENVSETDTNKKIRPSKEDERILRILESNEKVGELIDLVDKLTPEQQERLLYYARLEADHIGRKSDK